jgi:hypothetical protein
VSFLEFVFNDNILYLEEPHQDRLWHLVSKWAGGEKSQGQKVKATTSESSPSLLKVWSLAPRSGITVELLETQSLGT